MSKELTLREAQLIGLKIMKAFDVFCRENGLIYYLSGGTLLGAVRHKGFIPWDDDVDLMMPRADYQKMIAIGFPEGDCKLYSLENSHGYCRPWARLTDASTILCGESYFHGDSEGLGIDIFPIDGVPEGRLATKLFFKQIRLNDALCKSARRNRIPEGERLARIKAFLPKLLKPIGAKRFARRMNHIAMKQPFADSRFRGVSMVTHYGEREKMPAEVFDHPIELDFEDMKCPAPNGYDLYLTRLYGDYMQLPPESARGRHFARYAILEEDAP